MAQESTRNRRRNYVIDRPFQLSVAVTGVIAVSIATLAGLAGLFVLPDGEALENTSGDTLRMLLIGTTVAHFVLVAGAVCVVAILLTHRVAGPTAVLVRALDGLRRGDFSHRTTLRSKDYLQSLAAATGRLTETLEERDGERREFLAALERHLEHGDVDGCRELVATYHASFATDPVEEPAPEAVA